MRVQALKRWHWLLISVAVGVLFGGLRDVAFSDIDTQLPHESLSQKSFAAALASRRGDMIQGITVMRLNQERYGAIVNCVVPDHQAIRSGRAYTRPHWYEPTQFELQEALKELKAGQATSVPEKNEGLMRFLRKVSEALRIKPPDPPGGLLDYLRLATDAKGQHISFTYAWWRQPRVAIIAWTLLSVVVIGGIWPTVVNLIAFHSVFRPKQKKETKGQSLWHVKSAPTPAKAPAAVVSAREVDQLKALERELEARLRAGDVNMQPTSAAVPVPEAPVRKLTASELELAVPKQTEEEKLFDRKEGDFYPVERHNKPNPTE